MWPRSPSVSARQIYARVRMISSGGGMHDLDRSHLMYVLVTSSRLRGLRVQTCVSAHAVTGRIGAQPSYEPRCFISCEPPSRRGSQLDVCFPSAAPRWANSLICDKAVGKHADVILICPRAADDIFVQQQPKMANKMRNEKILCSPDKKK